MNIKKKIDTKLRIDLAHTLIVFTVLFSIFSIWVNHSFQGNYWGPFLPGSNFGIPSAEAEMGMYPTSDVGWDAQFYYYQSNDILAQGDEYLHIDNPAYRYQKIGMPLIAHIVSRILGQELTSPFLYHLLQFIIVSIGFFVLIRWLRKNNINQIYAYGWILSVGVINSLAYGMPDPVGDAFFIMSVIFALSGQLVFYMIATIMLLLVREGYALYAAIIFILTVFNKISWKCEKKNQRILLTMIPGIIVVLWMIYVTYRFGITPMAATRGAELTDLPLIGAVKTFIAAIKQGDVIRVVFNEFGVIILLFSIYNIIKVRKESYVWYAVIGYGFLMSSLGTTVWFDYSGYMKALGSIIAGLIISLAYNKKKMMISILCVIITLQGLGYNYYIKKNAFYTEYNKIDVVQNIENEMSNPLNEFNSHILTENNNVLTFDRKGIFKRFLRELNEIEVTVSNTSNENWYAYPNDGMYSMNISYRIYDESGIKVLFDGIRMPIGKDILSGEKEKFKIKFLVPSSSGKYILRISMLQEGVAWFNDVNGGYVDIPLQIK
ncbi:glycosyltransferase family protein [Clostridium butyricum]|uniref:hypothetical protein n=1 Tax=Clostridium butyricum TaxID=1492 RepID=UPI00374E5906